MRRHTRFALITAALVAAVIAMPAAYVLNGPKWAHADGELLHQPRERRLTEAAAKPPSRPAPPPGAPSPPPTSASTTWAAPRHRARSTTARTKCSSATCRPAARSPKPTGGRTRTAIVWSTRTSCSTTAASMFFTGSRGARAASTSRTRPHTSSATRSASATARTRTRRCTTSRAGAPRAAARWPTTISRASKTVPGERSAEERRSFGLAHQPGRRCVLRRARAGHARGLGQRHRRLGCARGLPAEWRRRRLGHILAVQHNALEPAARHLHQSPRSRPTTAAPSPRPPHRRSPWRRRQPGWPPAWRSPGRTPRLRARGRAATVATGT